ncbi:FecR family protein [Sunxiuqinia sp. A32]|uniref:FecR family protein n=1 Tax=Sunxiuqinia sp. A32 TaxID=3461496 RepID=UPI0040464128
MEQNLIHFDSLANKYLEGKLKGSEYDEFLSLISEEKFLTRFSHIKRNWSPSENMFVMMNWERLVRRISINTNTIENKTRRLNHHWFQAIAAVLIIGLLITSTIFYLKTENFIQGVTVVETPRGEKSKVVLPDGTEVWLNASSRIEYQSFTNKVRNISLVGEAFFKVTRNEKAPFIVKTPKCEVKVLGTEFNVMAYEQTSRNEVTLFKGSVEIATRNKKTILGIGEKLTVSEKGESKEQANLEQTYGWVENKLNFTSIPFGELIMRLENWYDVDIIYNENEFVDVEFTGTFKNEETIWEIIDAIGTYLPITYNEIENRKIQLMIK